jgi:nitroimidazol reductase NimA-like FMN-containing flavoprotein (pyridoxamine 5'-phosphate oxidase superfamily)
MLDKMKALAKAKDICVLATVDENVPHCSLMAYITDDEVREIYLVTHRDTRKYRNLVANPRVSLLIDTREEDTGERRISAKALTVSGRFQPITEKGRKELVRARLLERHPHLQSFIEDPEAEVIAIRIGSLQLLEGVTQSTYEDLS